AVHEAKDVAAGCVHPLAGWRDDPRRHLKRPLVRALQRQFHYDDIANGKEAVELSMHVRERLRVDLDGLPEPGRAVRPTVRDADGHVGEGPVCCERRDPSGNVHVLRHLVRLANDLLVAHVDVSPSWSGLQTTAREPYDLQPGP